MCNIYRLQDFIVDGDGEAFVDESSDDEPVRPVRRRRYTMDQEAILAGQVEAEAQARVDAREIDPGRFVAIPGRAPPPDSYRAARAARDQATRELLVTPVRELAPAPAHDDTPRFRPNEPTGVPIPAAAAGGGVSPIDIPVPAGFSWRTGARAGVSVPADLPVDEDPGELDQGEMVQVNPAHPDSFSGSKKGSRRWVFTLNSPSVDEYRLIRDFIDCKCKWGVIGMEFVTRPHLQGGFRLKDAVTRSALSKKPAFRHCWLGVARGTEEHVKNYSVKQGHFVEFHPEAYSAGQGTRTDIDSAVSRVRDEGMAGLSSLIAENPMFYVRYHSGLEKLASRALAKRKLSEPPEVVWFMGMSGHGKTYQAHKAAVAACEAISPGVSYYEWNTDNFPWFGGYSGEKVMLLNEFRSSNSRGMKIPMQTFCKMWDVLSFACEQKNGEVQLQCSKFFITCTQHPSCMYTDTAAEPIAQFLRRITKVIRCKKVERAGGPFFEVEDLGSAVVPIFNA